MDVHVYTFEDANGGEFGCYNTQDYDEAEKYAKQARLKIIDNTYEWADSEPAGDFTGG